MSNSFPQKRQFEDLQIEFYRIKNEKLAKIYELFVKNAAKAKPATIHKSNFETEEDYNNAVNSSELLAILDVIGDEKMDKARELFFKNMNIEGIGNVDSKLEDILEIDLGYSLQLFILAIEVYLGKYLNKLGEKPSIS